MILTSNTPNDNDTKPLDVQNLGPITALRMVEVEEARNFNAGPSEAGSTPSVDPPPYSATAGPRRPTVPAPKLKGQEVPPPQRTLRPRQLDHDRDYQLPTRDEPKRPLATNFLILRARHEPIEGTYFIDPSLTAFALDNNATSTVDRSHLMRKFKQRHRHYNRGAFKKQYKKLQPNMILGTKSGPINVDLSIVCPPEHITVQKTLVQAASKSGDVDIRVRHIHVRRQLNLEVSSRKGNITILIPRSFEGYIQSHNRKGVTKLLPAISRRMALISKTNNETQVFVGDSQPSAVLEWSGDTIHVDAGKGDVFIGYIGEDSKPVEQPGFWKKFACALKKEIANETSFRA